MKTDSSNNVYEKVSNIRVTYKRREKRISFRAYKNANSNSLHIGAELILKDKDTISQLIETLCRLQRRL
jgi:hypothetical protein